MSPTNIARKYLRTAIPVQILAATFGAVLLACGPGGETSRPAEPAATPLVFTAHGLPGPWWRVGASPKEFQRDTRSCRQQSSKARQRAASNALEAAYRAFLECMEGRRWKRGLPPERLGSDDVS